jgi:hypothetical protein
LYVGRFRRSPDLELENDVTQLLGKFVAPEASSFSVSRTRRIILMTRDLSAIVSVTLLIPLITFGP